MRRSFLLGGAAALAALATPRIGHASAARRISLRHSGTGARFSGSWHDGRRPDPVAMAELSIVLADAGALPARPFDPGAIEIAWTVAQQAGLAGDLAVHSGFRTPQVNRAVQGVGDSQHLRAMAVDLGVASGRLAAVAEAALRLARGGVGVYQRRSFVHLDSGPVRQWADASDGSSALAAMSPRERQLNQIATEWRRGRTLRIDTRLPNGW
ncbi:YcbK family protein [Falsiroseomonas oryziterrae]|uniref:YcbK family protein n=1 Tax=Falsiroseomonas oryziterrae TaxID=2911368 RepID=UPI001F1D39C8|nr:DUF882 domain-containing protein [Roseomonas sp. NPKOSM-4]